MAEDVGNDDADQLLGHDGHHWRRLPRRISADAQQEVLA